ncbi:MAG: hypothetical protein ACOYK8_00845 [Alphaproteobacteria bacterium]
MTGTSLTLHLHPRARAITWMWLGVVVVLAILLLLDKYRLLAMPFTLPQRYCVMAVTLYGFTQLRRWFFYGRLSQWGARPLLWWDEKNIHALMPNGKIHPIAWQEITNIQSSAHFFWQQPVLRIKTGNILAFKLPLLIAETRDADQLLRALEQAYQEFSLHNKSEDRRQCEIDGILKHHIQRLVWLGHAVIGGVIIALMTLIMKKNLDLTMVGVIIAIYSAVFFIRGWKKLQHILNDRGVGKNN